VFEGTLSGNFRIDNLTIIPEIRIDAAQNSLAFYKNGTESTGTTVSALVAVTYHF
jgi:hypothetical protein